VLIVLAVLVTVLIAFAVLLVALYKRMASPNGQLPPTPDWIGDLSPDRYRPMLRLLSSDDLHFLRSQPGYTPRMAAKLRKQRCQIFHGYLRGLTADFGRVCMALKLFMVYSRSDRADLASKLVSARMNFVRGMVAAQVYMILYRCGWCTVDAASLVKLFDTMRLELRALVPAELAAGA
jgi:hypothetical protein